MITVRDLQIGDWIEDGYRVAQVTSITCDGIVETTSAISNIEVIEPIPLTEDILVKNGFEYAYNEVSKMQNKQLLVTNIGGHYIEVRLDKKNVAIWYDYDENESGFYSDVFLGLPRTVHKLQHLLRLCGIEKEIEL